MCLIMDAELTKRGLKGKKVYSNGMIKVWKIFNIDNNNLCSPFFGKKYKIGWNVSNRSYKNLTRIERKYNHIYKGIHVFLTRKSARIYARHELPYIGKTKIVLVYVKIDDFMAIGKYYKFFTIDNYSIKEAVFTEAYLNEKDYNKAIKG